VSVVEETVRDIRRANARYTATDQSIEFGVPYAFDAESNYQSEYHKRKLCHGRPCCSLVGLFEKAA